ncbi:MAG: alpha/beta fold hydrolase [Bacteroidota bacterium]
MQLLHSIILGEGQPLLILHGFFGMGDNWKSLANQFSGNYQVHIIDQRNHGRSFHSDDFSYELMIADLFFYISHHDLDNVNILGHSMGGKTAMQFAVEFPEMVNKIVVADIAPKFYPPHHQQIFEALNNINLNDVGSRQEIDDILKNYINDPGIRQFLLKNVYRKNKTDFAYRFNLDSLIENVEEVGVGLPNFTEFDGETLFLKGENSNYITKEDETLIKTHFPNSEIVEISNAGHWLHSENQIDFYNEIMKFLEN